MINAVDITNKTPLDYATGPVRDVLLANGAETYAHLQVIVC